MGRIVVGVDASPGSREALRWAAAEAKLRGAELHVVHAWQLPYLAELPGRALERLMEDALRDADTVVDTVLRDVVGDEADAAAVRREVREGSAAERLLEASRDADLLVVGSRGLGGFKGLLLGSVSQHCAHYARCPVVIVRTAEA